MMSLQQLKKQLAKVEKKLDKCRTSTYVDGFGTMKYAKKARKWDYYAQEKIRLKRLIEEAEERRRNILSLNINY